MEMRRFLYFVVISCVIHPPLSAAKTVSLNELIAAEERRSKPPGHRGIHDVSTEQSLTNRDLLRKTSKNTETFADRIFPHKAYTLPTLSHLKRKLNKQFKEATETLKLNIKKPKNLNKKFQIDLPLKPKFIFPKSPLQLNRQSLKRETLNHGKFNEKYAPLFQDIGSLFDDLLGVHEREYIERETKSRQIHRNVIDNEEDCPCAHTHHRPQQYRPQQKKKTATVSSPPAFAVPFDRDDQAEAPSEATYYTADGDVSRLRPDPDVPVLPAGDPAGRRRNHHGVGEGGRASLHRGLQGDITGDHGDSQHHTGRQGHHAHTAHDEEDTDHTARDGASRDGSDRGLGRHGDEARTQEKRISARGNQKSGKRKNADGKPRVKTTTDTHNRAGVDEIEAITDAALTSRETRGDLNEPEIEDQHQDSGDAAEYTEPVRSRQLNRQLRGRPVSKYQVGNIAEPIQSTEDNGESLVSVTQHLTSNQRVSKGSGSHTAKDQDVRATDEAVISINNYPKVSKQDPNKKVVMIIDGYSHTRGKFLDDEVAEKAIYID
ncbi:uncharacterized protein LOC119691015 [Plutella xylostella]|uniref:uncharacterized protein LOC119691015 n=1 Tax=Plutella xylostella TaxID=51655 RepID=UPI002032DA46|nr:uncharacterized protein LOC119691015 [Plutella xylostella]